MYVCILKIDWLMETDCFGQCVFGATNLWFQLWTNEWMNEWVSEHKRGEGRRQCMSDQPGWHHTINCGSVYFLELKRCETVFVIMKIIIMMIIIMMVIKRGKKNLLQMLALLPRTLTLLNSCTWALDEGGWHLPCSPGLGVGTPVSGDKRPPPAGSWCP